MAIRKDISCVGNALARLEKNVEDEVGKVAARAWRLQAKSESLRLYQVSVTGPAFCADE